ncbi:hypothetical protein RIR_e45613_A0A2N0P2L1_9GLOM [Rhizophagus irregularis DAOM 181602=DAOM 197198]|nr:hypothetical protein RIR_e45613_A0A2N0P2L1_9GLOM [Rhizophagus irregularis DAOM 181602=DAOM 197198]
MLYYSVVIVLLIMFHTLYSTFSVKKNCGNIYWSLFIAHKSKFHVKSII